MTYKLPYDCSRCNGRMRLPDGRIVDCQIRDQCSRYLSRNDLGPRTPFLMHYHEIGVACDDFLEVEEDVN